MASKSISSSIIIFSITLHNLVTDLFQGTKYTCVLGSVDTRLHPFSSKWLGTPDLNVDYMDNFSGNPPFTGENNVFMPSTPGTGKTQTVLDIINAYQRQILLI